MTQLLARRSTRALAMLACLGVVALTGCQTQSGAWQWPWSASTAPANDTALRLSLSGANEVPPVTTAATGSGTITIGADRTVRGSISVTGMTPTAAHIHTGPAGANGPVIIPLTRGGETTFNVPADAKLSDAQWADFQAGKLYVNVHSAAHPNGEIRAQLKAG
jgi:hypothetical protein